MLEVEDDAHENAEQACRHRTLRVHHVDAHERRIWPVAGSFYMPSLSKLPKMRSRPAFVSSSPLARRTTSSTNFRLAPRLSVNKWMPSLMMLSKKISRNSSITRFIDILNSKLAGRTKSGVEYLSVIPRHSFSGPPRHATSFGVMVPRDLTYENGLRYLCKPTIVKVSTR
jgi:hypothetical protein